MSRYAVVLRIQRLESSREPLNSVILTLNSVGLAAMFAGFTGGTTGGGAGAGAGGLGGREGARLMGGTGLFNEVAARYGVRPVEPGLTGCRNGDAGGEGLW